MAMIDEALSRLRQHSMHLEGLAQELREADPAPADLADRLSKAARNAAEDVETLHILSIALTPAAISKPSVEVEGTAGAAEPAGPQKPAASLPKANDLLQESMSEHDRDYANGRDGIPAHNAGEMPDVCPACAVFAVLLQPQTSSSITY